jgi:hypothetical protein
MYSYTFLFAACLPGLVYATTAAGEYPLAGAQVAALAR